MNHIIIYVLIFIMIKECQLPWKPNYQNKTKYIRQVIGIYSKEIDNLERIHVYVTIKKQTNNRHVILTMDILLS